MSAFSFSDGGFLSFFQAHDRPSYAESNGIVRTSRIGNRSGQIGCIEELAAILFQQQFPFGENRLPVPSDEIAAVQRIEQNGNTANIVYPKMKPGMATEQGVYIIGSNLRAEQRISVGAVCDSLQLVARKAAAKGKWHAVRVGI